MSGASDDLLDVVWVVDLLLFYFWIVLQEEVFDSADLHGLAEYAELGSVGEYLV